MSRFIDITGKKFGKLIVVSLNEKTKKYHKAYWLCKCECGNERIVLGNLLRNGSIQDCGYLNHKELKNRITKRRIQYILYAMKQRCYDKNSNIYKYYGAKGVKICDEWLNNTNNFIEWALKNGYNDSLTIERINVNGNYEPSNCKFITKTEQGYNKNNSVLYTINNETKCLSEWCRQFNIDYHIVYKRLKRGRTIEEALTKPIDKTKRNKLCKRKDD